jgi:hypothetical protein
MNHDEVLVAEVPKLFPTAERFYKELKRQSTIFKVELVVQRGRKVVLIMHPDDEPKRGFRYDPHMAAVVEKTVLSPLTDTVFLRFPKCKVLEKWIPGLEVKALGVPPRMKDDKSPRQVHDMGWVMDHWGEFEMELAVQYKAAYL